VAPSLNFTEVLAGVVSTFAKEIQVLIRSWMSREKEDGLKNEPESEDRLLEAMLEDLIQIKYRVSKLYTFLVARKFGIS
jgi:hypothetical protein